jgi:hypothetical protein
VSRQPVLHVCTGNMVLQVFAAVVWGWKEEARWRAVLLEDAHLVQSSAKREGPIYKQHICCAVRVMRMHGLALAGSQSHLEGIRARLLLCCSCSQESINWQPVALSASEACMLCFATTESSCIVLHQRAAEMLLK